jgi:hypothetical protein
LQLANGKARQSYRSFAGRAEMDSIAPGEIQFAGNSQNFRVMRRRKAPRNIGNHLALPNSTEWRSNDNHKNKNNRNYSGESSDWPTILKMTRTSDIAVGGISEGQQSKLANESVQTTRQTRRSPRNLSGGRTPARWGGANIAAGPTELSVCAESPELYVLNY